MADRNHPGSCFTISIPFESKEEQPKLKF